MGESHKDSPMVRVTGFEPAASWSQTGTENFFWTFPMIFHHFRSYSVTLVPSFEPPFPPVPRASVVIHVVKNASRQKRREAFLHLSADLSKEILFHIWDAAVHIAEPLVIREAVPAVCNYIKSTGWMPAVSNAHDFQWFSAGRARSDFPCLTSGAISLLCFKCI